MSPSGPAATNSSNGVMANWPMRGYCGRQLVVLRAVTRSGPWVTAAGMGEFSGAGFMLLASGEPGVATKVADEVEAGEREATPAVGLPVQSMGNRLIIDAVQLD